MDVHAINANYVNEYTKNSCTSTRMPFITNSVLLNSYLKRISLGGDSLQRSNENVHKLKRIIKIKKKTIPEKVF